MNIVNLYDEWLMLGVAKRDLSGRSEKMKYITSVRLFSFINRHTAPRAIETSTLVRILKSSKGGLYAEFYRDGSIQSYLAPLIIKVNVRFVEYIPKTWKEIEWCYNESERTIPQEIRMLLRG